MATKKVVSNVVAALCALFNREVTDALENAWILALKGIDDEKVKYGMERILTEYKDKFMPVPAEFLAYCLTERGKTWEIEAEQAFDDLITQIGKGGYTGKPDFISPITFEYVENQGGWRQVCQWISDDLTWKRKDFIGFYKSFKSGGRVLKQKLQISENVQKQLENTIFTENPENGRLGFFNLVSRIKKEAKF